LPEARSFRESGPHGVILGEIEKESAQFKFLEIGKRRYFEKTLLIQSDMEGLAAKTIGRNEYTSATKGFV